MQTVKNNANPVLKLKSINKSFSNQKVFSNFQLEIASGSTVLLLGANGSGKSTLLRICVGLSRPDSGQVLLEGEKVNPAMIGYCGHDLMLYSHLTVDEHIRFVMSIRGIRSSLDSILDEWRLSNCRGKKIIELSRGLQYRTALVLSLLHQPRFLFLDEPTSSLDDLSLQALLGSILGAAQNGFILMATHDIERVQHIASRVIVLNHGSIAFDTALVSKEKKNNSAAIEQAIKFYRDHNR